MTLAIEVASLVKNYGHTRALDGLDAVAFLEHLGREAGGPVQVVWDRSPIHRRAAVGEFVEAAGGDGLALEFLPAYAPDLNPVEMLWGNVKGVELANLCPQTIDEAWTAAEAGLVRAGRDYQLCFNLLDHTGLSL